jgi:ATP-dependent DNA helicase RecG
LVDPSDLVWLRRVTSAKLSDEEARALVFAREVGAINNAAYRDINRVDTLQASMHLRRLRDLGALKMKGSGNRTYYVLAVAVPAEVDAEVQPPVGLGHGVAPDPPMVEADPPMVEADPPMVVVDPHMAGVDPHMPTPVKYPASTGARAAAPKALLDLVHAAGTRPRRDVLRGLIVQLCGWRALTAKELAELLGKRDVRELVRVHLHPMVQAGVIAHAIPEMPRHPQQRYVLKQGAHA